MKTGWGLGVTITACILAYALFSTLQGIIPSLRKNEFTITQLIYGLLAPSNMKVNLMTASLTGGAAIHAADLLTDLESGYVLGANPRKQLIAQLWGVAAGTLFVVPAYLLLIKPEDIGSDRWPAPAAQIWAGVAKVLAQALRCSSAACSRGCISGPIARAPSATAWLWPRASSPASR